MFACGEKTYRSFVAVRLRMTNAIAVNGYVTVGNDLCVVPHGAQSPCKHTKRAMQLMPHGSFASPQSVAFWGVLYPAI